MAEVGTHKSREKMFRNQRELDDGNDFSLEARLEL
jgi:hypothetical protein